jgi:AcrR family transcriptional regulator
VRVSAATKLATRNRILEGARSLFCERGFQGVTTRDIARTARIATGTLFNYFATKEAIAAEIAIDSLADVHARFEKNRRRTGSLEEDLFALIAAELRGLKPHRNYFWPVIETSLNTPASATNKEGGSIRAGHWAMVSRIFSEHGISEPPSFVTIHLYWTLYTGVLTFWSSDPSPSQEDSLAVLDHSLKAFLGSLTATKCFES